jgi:hypothetical protein
MMLADGEHVATCRNIGTVVIVHDADVMGQHTHPQRRRAHRCEDTH